MTDTDIMLILEKLDKFEQKLKELEAEIGKMRQSFSTPKYEPWQSDDPSAPYYRRWKETLVRGKVYRIPTYPLEQPEFLPDVLLVEERKDESC